MFYEVRNERNGVSVHFMSGLIGGYSGFLEGENTKLTYFQGWQQAECSKP